MRLPLWFTVGNAFSSTAGFTVCAQARDGLWTSDAHPGDRRDLEVRIPEEIVSEHEPSEIFLFLAMPHACALLLGNAWDRMPATTVFWDMGRPGSYEPALRVN